MALEGIHHITAITGDAPLNVDFYTRVLGLRMVAKTVNQDDPTVYHLFYADEAGSPGADITFFEYPGAAPGRDGAGMVHRILSRVDSDEALNFWEQRLADAGIETERHGGGNLRFSDPEGLGHELVVSDLNQPLAAVHPEIPEEHALKGFLGVRAFSADASRSGELLTGAMGAKSADGATFELAGDLRTGTISFEPAPVEAGVPGAGTVHHVAWGSSVDEHPNWVGAMRAAGMPATDVIDRHYFKSIYFREPSGVLYEIADFGPGFTRDLPAAELGTKVILPPWLESQRDAIEARLTPLPDPRASLKS